ncbi:FAD-dependent oxidoreductase [Arthrobacter sp. K5]|uniref:FAD-dependent oxidoreductase n=1 Tax=Arthrobacter sp. K5 TaxID=2839623 RepID=A0AAU8EY72_9MICC
MVERSTVGGTCVNTGCIPSKALLAAAEARHVSPSMLPDGSPVSAPPQSRWICPNWSPGSAHWSNPCGQRSMWISPRAMDGTCSGGTAVFAGTAAAPVLNITAPGGTTETVSAEHYLVATGSTPWIPEVPGMDEVDYLTSTSAMELQDVPASMLVVGGGYVALEQAQLFARLGTEVTILVRSKLASAEEPEAGHALAGVFADEGIRVVRRATASSVRTDEVSGDVVVDASVSGGNEEFRAARLLMATGRRPVTEDLNLCMVGVETGDRGEVLVDGSLRSTNPRIWAAGDVTGHPEFVYVAAAHGA